MSRYGDRSASEMHGQQRRSQSGNAATKRISLQRRCRGEDVQTVNDSVAHALALPGLCFCSLVTPGGAALAWGYYLAAAAAAARATRRPITHIIAGLSDPAASALAELCVPTERQAIAGIPLPAVPALAEVCVPWEGQAITGIPLLASAAVAERCMRSDKYVIARITLPAVSALPGVLPRRGTEKVAGGKPRSGAAPGMWSPAKEPWRGERKPFVARQAFAQEQNKEHARFFFIAEEECA